VGLAGANVVAIEPPVEGDRLGERLDQLQPLGQHRFFVHEHSHVLFQLPEHEIAAKLKARQRCRAIGHDRPAGS
jgi:hypothetical protein